MADGPTAINLMPGGGDPFDQLLSQVRAAAEGVYDVLGEMGRSKSGNVVYLAREIESGNLVAMKLSRTGGNDFNLEVVRTLDSSVPGLESTCPECRNVLRDWDRFCFKCGADLSANQFSTEPDEAAQLLDAVREATAGTYDIYGKMDRADGGGVVFFARDIARNKVVALRLKRDAADTTQSTYSIGETQVFRPLAAELGATQVLSSGQFPQPPQPPLPPPPAAEATPTPPPRTGPVAAPPPPVARTAPRLSPKLIGGIAGAALLGLIGYFAFRDPGTPVPPPPPPEPPVEVAQTPAPADTTSDATTTPEPEPTGSEAAATADSGTLVVGITIPAGASVTLDGARIGRQVRTSAGVHRLAIAAEGFRPVSERVTVEGGGTVTWRPKLVVQQREVATNTPPPPPPPPPAPTCVRSASRSEWTVAFDLCRKDAAAGDAQAQRLLAAMYDYGRGTTKDQTQAAQWYTRAAAAGDRESQERLGYLYRDGLGVKKDETRSATFFRQAAEGGRPAAQLELGVAFEDGKGVKEDDAEAARWYERAWNGGSPIAARRLARLYERGQGVKKDETEAARWYRLAADKKDAEAQYQLGRMYKDGKGVPKSEPEALEWFRKAMLQGHRDAASEVRKLERP
ncbi:MAG: PEGA domain-containing protein [Gemmatimonadales bacterium]